MVYRRLIRAAVVVGLMLALAASPLAARPGGCSECEIVAQTAVCVGSEELGGYTYCDAWTDCFGGDCIEFCHAWEPCMWV